MECPVFPELDYTEWDQALTARIKGQRYPLGGILELTNRCNLSCVHCYINQPAANRAIQAQELSTPDVLKLLDQMVEAGTLTLTLTGGEVLVRPDFAEIYIYARQHGILVTIFTNGTLITPRIADVFKEYRPLAVEITLYGASKETYKRMTGIPGSYEHCREGIALLVERGVPVNLKSFLTTLNFSELSEMKTFADKLGVKFRYDAMTFPRLDGNQDPLNFQLPIKDVLEMDLHDPERLRAWTEYSSRRSGKLIRDEYIFNCGAGLRSFHIDSMGRMSLCIVARQPSYDLHEMSFQDAWEKLGDVRKKNRSLETPCRTCTIGEFCMQCPGWSQTVHGDDETPVDFVCQLAHLRAEQFQK